MKQNCDGCDYEWEEVCRLVKLGCHLATTKDEHNNPFSKEHYCILVVDEEGRVIAC